MATLAVLGLSTAIPLIIQGVQSAQQNNKERQLSLDFIRQSREAYRKAKAAGLANFLPKIITDPMHFQSAEDRAAYEQAVIAGLNDIQGAIGVADQSTLGKAAQLKQMGFNVDVKTGALGPSATAYGDDIDRMWQLAQNTSGRQVTQEQANNLKNTRFALPAGYTFKTANDYQQWQSQVEDQGQQMFVGAGGSVFTANNDANRGLRNSVVNK